MRALIIHRSNGITALTLTDRAGGGDFKLTHATIRASEVTEVLVIADTLVIYTRSGRTYSVRGEEAALTDVTERARNAIYEA